METQKYTNTYPTSADMLRKYQDMIVENQGDDEDLEEAKDKEDQVDEAQNDEDQVDEAKDDDDQVDEAKDEDEKEEVKEEIPSTSMLRRYQDMIKEAEKEDEEVDESKEEEVDESKEEEVDESHFSHPTGGTKTKAQLKYGSDKADAYLAARKARQSGGDAGTRLGSSSIGSYRDPKTGEKSYTYARTTPHDGHTDSVYRKGKLKPGTDLEQLGKDIQKYYKGPDAYKKGPGKFPTH